MLPGLTLDLPVAVLPPEVGRNPQGTCVPSSIRVPHKDSGSQCEEEPVIVGQGGSTSEALEGLFQT